MAYTNPGKARKGAMPEKGAAKDKMGTTAPMGTAMKKSPMKKKK